MNDKSKYIIIFFTTCFFLIHDISLASDSNICKLLADNIYWYRVLETHKKETHISVAEVMSILKHESNFINNAKPVKHWLIPNIISYKNYSSAYGYAQVIDSTWNEYIKEKGDNFMKRSSFYDSADFVFWYFAKYNKYIKKNNNTSEKYLLYHQGPSAYKNKRFSSRLVDYALSVDKTAKAYNKDLNNCRNGLNWMSNWSTF